MKTFTDYMNEGVVDYFGDFRRCKKLELNDGTQLSIQASQGHYCSPRITLEDYKDYSEFEIGFPTKEVECLIPYAEDSSDPTGTVYGYVPKTILEEAIESCGGVKGFVV